MSHYTLRGFIALSLLAIYTLGENFMSFPLSIHSTADQQYYSEIKSVEKIKGKNVNFCLLRDVYTIPNLEKITSVAVVPLIRSDEMVAILLERGLDIPGGHVEATDDRVVGTVKREAYEEARISLANPLYLIGIISSDYMGNTPEQTTYMLITVGRVDRLDDFVAEFESTGREIVATSEFLERYTAGSHAMMEEFINRSRSLSGKLFPGTKRLG